MHFGWLLLGVDLRKELIQAHLLADSKGPGTWILGGVAAIEASKETRTHQAHEKKPQSHARRMRRRAYAELSDPADQDIGNREVEDTPKHVYGRRRKSLTRWLGKGALKGTTHRPADEV